MKDGRARVVRTGVYWDVDQYANKEWEGFASFDSREDAINCAKAISEKVLGEEKYEVVE